MSTVRAIQTFDAQLVEASLTRPSDTTQYAAGEVISAVTTNDHYTFAEMGDPRKLTGQIDRAIITSSDAAGTLPDLELWLFDTEIAEVADNAAFAPTDAEILTLVGVLLFPVASWKVGLVTTGNSFCEATNTMPFRYKTGPTLALYGQLVVRNTYTPVSAQVFKTRMYIRRDV